MNILRIFVHFLLFSLVKISCLIYQSVHTCLLMQFLLQIFFKIDFFFPVFTVKNKFLILFAVSSNVIIDKVAHDGFGTCVWKSIAEDRLCFSDGSFDGRFFMLVFCEQGLSMHLWSELWSGGRGRAATGYFSTVPWLLSGSNSTKTFFVWYVCIFLLLGL